MDHNMMQVFEMLSDLDDRGLVALKPSHRTRRLFMELAVVRFNLSPSVAEYCVNAWFVE